MAETKKGEGLVYKNHPLRRVDNLIYYGSMADKYIVLLKILDTKKEKDMDYYNDSMALFERMKNDEPITGDTTAEEG